MRDQAGKNEGNDKMKVESNADEVTVRQSQ